VGIRDWEYAYGQQWLAHDATRRGAIASRRAPIRPDVVAE
jgi:hypothetical protein